MEDAIAVNSTDISDGSLATMETLMSCETAEGSGAFESIRAISLGYMSRQLDQALLLHQGDD